MSGICAHGIGLDCPCVRCSMMGPTGGLSSPVDPRVMARISDWITLGERGQNAVLAERSRIRAIISHTYGNDWHGQKVLDAIDSGLTVEQLKEGKK